MVQALGQARTTVPDGTVLAGKEEIETAGAVGGRLLPGR